MKQCPKCKASPVIFQDMDKYGKIVICPYCQKKMTDKEARV